MQQIQIRILAPWNLLSKKRFDFLCVRSSITHNVAVHVHVLWLVFTHGLIRCRHSADKYTQTTYTAQTHHTSIPTVVVSLMVHVHMYVNMCMYMYMCLYVYLCVYNEYVSMCVCKCVKMRLCVVCCLFVLSGPDRW